MAGDQQTMLVATFLQDFDACCAGRIGVEASKTVDLGRGDLHGMVQRVAGEQPAVAAVLNVQVAMAGRMTGSGQNGHAVADLMLAVQNLRLPGLDDGNRTVEERVAGVVPTGQSAAPGIERLDVGAGEQIFGVGKRRNPAAIV